MKSTRIVIVNFKTPGLVIDCLRSLVDEVRAVGDCQVIVVENGSPDDSAQRLADAIRTEHWDSWAKLLVLDKNLGFAGGNNAALRPLLAEPKPADYFLLLNPDTVVRPGAVTTLIEFLEHHPRAGIAGSRLEDPDGTPQRSAFRFPTVPSEFEHGIRLGPISRLLRSSIVAPPVTDATHRCDWLAGASMLVRKEVFDDIGLMDDDYFLYYEETDFMLRAKRAGWSTWYVPTSRVVHLVGQASGVTDTKKPARRLPKYWFDSRKRYFTKNHGPVYALWADAAWLIGFTLWRVRRRLQRKPDLDPPHYLWDFVHYNFLAS
ncbi:MAG: glycosyltransferase family 2 protein [Planctomycetia bacterium]|nr:glycosyltransferase family 2 protein [Planctomycetia bacterium]